MSKLNCPCGWQISDIMWPNPDIGELVPSFSIDILEEKLDMIIDGISVWECQKCGRIAIGNKKVKWYMPEDGKPGKIMGMEYIKENISQSECFRNRWPDYIFEDK